MGVNYRDIDNSLGMFQNEFSKPGERPDNVSIEAIIGNSFGESTYELEKALSDILDLTAFLESNKKNVSQEGVIKHPKNRKHQEFFQRRGYWPNYGDGYYQLEVREDGGGFTRANAGYRNLPKELTPAWFHDQMVMAKSQDNRWAMSHLDKDEQDFIMASFLLNDPISRDLIQSVSQEGNGATRMDMIVNYWLDNHWAGWQGKNNGETVRENKKINAINRINKDYKYDPNWLKLHDNLDYEFNMDNY